MRVKTQKSHPALEFNEIIRFHQAYELFVAEVIRRVAQKLAHFCMPNNLIKYLPIFSFYHHHNQEKIGNSTITKRSHRTSSVSLYYLVKCQCLKNSNNKQDDLCNNTF